MAKKRSNRGGYRQPSKPAAVATPQVVNVQMVDLEVKNNL